MKQIWNCISFLYLSFSTISSPAFHYVLAWIWTGSLKCSAHNNFDNIGYVRSFIISM
jgi:hypothetical protein